MLTLYVEPCEESLVTADGIQMFVRGTVAREGSEFISLRDWEPSTEVVDVEVVVGKRFFSKKIQLPQDVKRAVLNFLRNYHAKQDESFDCYSFSNEVKGLRAHRAYAMRLYWETKSLPWFIPIGSVVFLLGEEGKFYHAAIYIGCGLYISVWGAGGDLEFATLKSMCLDYGAERVVLARPKTEDWMYNH